MLVFIKIRMQLRNGFEARIFSIRNNLNIWNILNNNELSNHDKQIKLENYLFNSLKSNFLKDLRDPTKLAHNESLILLIRIINKCERVLLSLKDANNIHLTNKSYKILFMSTPVDIIISIVITHVIPFALKHSILNDQKTTSLFEAIGKNLVNEYNNIIFNKYINNEPIFNSKGIILNLPSGLSKQELILKLEVIPSETYIKYALDLCILISEHTKLFKIVESFIDTQKSKRHIILDDNCKNQLLDVLTYNIQMPMVSQPNDWEITINKDNNFIIKKYGGWLNNDNSFIHKSFKNKGDIKIVNQNVINTINFLQNTPYIINNEVLDVIIDLINDNKLSDLIITDFHPESSNLNNFMKNKDYVKVNEILTTNSLCYNNMNILSNAMLLRNMVNIYYPIFIDWRGRYYTYTPANSYQGSDLAKSLILFKKGSILNDNGIKSLKIFTGLSYSLIGKVSNNDIINWVDDNIDDIVNIKNGFWLKAKEPFMALAASIELKNFLEDKDNFISRLPIYIDATCNGIQHLSAMAADNNLASYVNISKSTDNDLPKDFYQHMVEYIVKDVKKLIEDNPDLAILDQILFNRSFIKKCIMTIPYGVTVRGMRDQLTNSHFIYKGNIANKKSFNLKKEFLKNPTLETSLTFNLNDINILAKSIHNILFNTYPSLTKVVEYLKDVNKFLKKLDVSFGVLWKTPSGLIIQQKYVDFDTKILNTSILNYKKSISLKIPNINKISLIKQNQAIIPNIIHSLDASNVSLLANKLIINNDKVNLLTIHDCFATNANNIPLLSLLIKKSFLEIYNDKNYLEDYNSFVLNYLIEMGLIYRIEGKYYNNKGDLLTLPEVPKLKTNISEVDFLESKYFVY